MLTIYWIVMGSIAMAIGSMVLGIWLRSNPSRENAEKSSRVMQFLFFAGPVIPPTIGWFIPGFTHFDELIGLPSLPGKLFVLFMGVLPVVPGVYFSEFPTSYCVH